MSEAVRFLQGLSQVLATMTLYADGHPARMRGIQQAFERLQRLQEVDPRPRFSFLGQDVVYGETAVRELADWDWSLRLANVGVQRLELLRGTTLEEFELFLMEVLARLQQQPIDSSTRSPDRQSTIKYGAIGIKGTGETIAPESVPVAKTTYSLDAEAETVQWMHREVQERGTLPLLEAESVVRSLSVAMHGDREMVVPLLKLKEFDQYTTTHSLNVSVLTMGLAEWLGLGPKDVRAFGVAGLLHDLGKVRVPREVLNKPGKLSEEEWVLMRQHPADGARIIFESDRNLDLAAAVAYEHHMMIDGRGYPRRHFERGVHHASKLVHVCDVYDALRTVRPYRDSWGADEALYHIERHAGSDFDLESATAFCAMMRKWEERPAVLA
jgi:putative nucleotidyltransferase with HDIG domain